MIINFNAVSQCCKFSNGSELLYRMSVYYIIFNDYAKNINKHNIK